MPRLRLLAVAAGLAISAAPIVAQDTQQKTHTVKRGDTLWDIAKLYLNDPFLWPEIYRVNTDVIEDPHWIYPGEVLRIPDIASLQQRSRDEMAAQQPRRQAPEPEAPPPKAAVYQSMVLTIPHTAVRAKEYLASPYAAPDGGPRDAGRIVSRASGGSTQVTKTMDDRLLQFDMVVIEPPAGVHPVKGDRFLVFRLGDHLGGKRQVVEPVGTVQVEDEGTGNGVVIASTRDFFHDVMIGNRLMVMDTLVARTDVYPSATDSPLMNTIQWLQRAPLLPSIGDYMIVGFTANDGVVTGDQISIVRPRGKDKNGDQLPDEVLGVAQIHRVTEQGASAILIQVNSAGIGVGSTVRLTAKMP
ncbi:MAG TPA: LysM peptidoglycan-binding domain-containing protein [Gemmatimonadaceae bacterium]|nr:LysM peptidoglycan-binding domain-containing protein [Gemmatimonadaceae bacterium]